MLTAPLGHLRDGFEPCTVCLHCPLSDSKSFPHNAWSRRSRLNSLVGAFVRASLASASPVACTPGVSIAPRRAGRNFRSRKLRHELSAFTIDPRSTRIGIHEGGNFRVDGDAFIRAGVLPASHGDASFLDTTFATSTVGAGAAALVSLPRWRRRSVRAARDAQTNASGEDDAQ